jgi:hypothetical protein
MPIRNLLATLVAALALIAVAMPQQPVDKSKRPSPPGTAEITLQGKKITIEYSRPLLRGRKMETLTPNGQVWRTGANEATSFVTEGDLNVGGTNVPAGKYTLYSLPLETTWKLIVNKQTGQWGTVYDEAQDLARIDTQTCRGKDMVEQFTISFDKKNADTADLVLAWETTRVAVPIKVSSAPQPPVDKSKRPSPPGTAEVTLQGKKITIEYSRPSLRNRKMETLAPRGQVWRTGANEATTFATEADVNVGGTNVPAGNYTLYTLPSEGTWKLIINKQTGQWGTVYNDAQDLARIDMQKGQMKEMVEQFTISFDKKTADAADLVLTWENTRVSVPIKLASASH